MWVTLTAEEQDGERFDSCASVVESLKMGDFGGTSFEILWEDCCQEVASDGRISTAKVTEALVVAVRSLKAQQLQVRLS